MANYGFTVKELEEKERLKEEDILTLKTWVREENLPDFPNETLALFYLACQNDIKATKKCTKAYFEARKYGPELFNDRDILRADIQHQLRILNFCIMPTRTDEGYVIVFHRLIDFDAAQYHMEVAMKVLFMTIDAAVHDDPPTGIITLFDMRGVGLRHLTRIKLGAIKKFFFYVQEALPLRLVQIHVLNVVWFIDKIFKLIKPFIKPEVLEQLHFHSSNINMEDFYKNHIPKKCLPVDYGGDIETIAELQKKNIAKLTAMQEFFKKEEIMRTI